MIAGERLMGRLKAGLHTFGAECFRGVGIRGLEFFDEGLGSGGVVGAFVEDGGLEKRGGDGRVGGIVGGDAEEGGNGEVELVEAFESAGLEEEELDGSVAGGGGELGVALLQGDVELFGAEFGVDVSEGGREGWRELGVGSWLLGGGDAGGELFGKAIGGVGVAGFCEDIELEGFKVFAFFLGVGGTCRESEAVGGVFEHGGAGAGEVSRAEFPDGFGGGGGVGVDEVGESEEELAIDVGGSNSAEFGELFERGRVYGADGFLVEGGGGFGVGGAEEFGVVEFGDIGDGESGDFVEIDEFREAAADGGEFAILEAADLGGVGEVVGGGVAFVGAGGSGEEEEREDMTHDERRMTKHEREGNGQWGETKHAKVARRVLR
jgi:hypothetical protein